MWVSSVHISSNAWQITVNLGASQYPLSTSTSRIQRPFHNSIHVLYVLHYNTTLHLLRYNSTLFCEIPWIQQLGGPANSEYRTGGCLCSRVYGIGFYQSLWDWVCILAHFVIDFGRNFKFIYLIDTYCKSNQNIKGKAGTIYPIISGFWADINYKERPLALQTYGLFCSRNSDSHTMET